MGRVKESQEEVYIKAIQTLRPGLRELLGPEEAARLNRRLGQYMRRVASPEHRDAALTRALAAIGEHPPARERMALILHARGVEDLRLLYGPLAGDQEIPAGTLMVCPIDPSHCRRRLQFVGQRLRCPEHDVALVVAQE